MVKTKILLVEDDKSLREIYGIRLYQEGYDIISAGDGEEALALAIKERPPLIISDVMMPKISGFDMLDILRSTTETKDIKVIMMTALSSEDQRTRGESLGADRYLVKSQVGIEDVVRTVHEVLGDAPVSSAGGTDQQLTTPTAAPAPQPAPAAVTPSPAPVAPLPQAPTSPVAPTMPFTPSQPTPVAPNQPAPSVFTTQQPPEPQPTSPLPQPTAPFSTRRPANLGDRVIHPLANTSSEGAKDFGAMMNEELTTQAQPTAPAQTEQPQAPVMDAIPSGLEFEETPKGAVSMQSFYTQSPVGAPPQPVAATQPQPFAPTVPSQPPQMAPPAAPQPMQSFQAPPLEVPQRPTELPPQPPAGI